MRTQERQSSSPAERKETAGPAPRGVPPLLGLQRTAGNQAVEAMLTAQRAGHEHGGGCGHAEEFADPQAAQRAVTDVLGSGGQALSGSRLSTMQNIFQADLSGVREFRGAAAQRATSLVNADAFTVGQNIVYGRQTPEIEFHEMTHAVSPTTEVATDLGGGLGVTSPGQDGERLAAQNGKRIAAGGSSLVTGVAQRQVTEDQEGRVAQRAPSTSTKKRKDVTPPPEKEGRQTRSRSKPQADLNRPTLSFTSSYVGARTQHRDQDQSIYFDQTATLTRPANAVNAAEALYDFRQQVDDNFVVKWRTGEDLDEIEEQDESTSWQQDGPYRPPYTDTQITLTPAAIQFLDQPGFSTDRLVTAGNWLEYYRSSFRWVVRRRDGVGGAWTSPTVSHEIDMPFDPEKEAAPVRPTIGGNHTWQVEIPEA